MALGCGPAHSPVPQVPGVFPQAEALHLVAPRDAHHQDRLHLHHPAVCQRGGSSAHFSKRRHEYRTVI